MNSMPVTLKTYRQMKSSIALVFSMVFSVTSLFAQNTELIPFRHKNRWGLSNQKGELVIPAIYDEVSFFDSDAPDATCFQVKKGYSYGLLDEKGEVLVPVNYSKISTYRGGDFLVTDHYGKEGLINAEGKTVFPAFFDEINYAKSHDIGIVKRNRKYGLVSGKLIDKLGGSSMGEHMLDGLFIYDDLYIMGVGKEVYFVALSKGKKGCFNKRGEVVIQFDYLLIEEQEGKIIAYKSNERTEFDASGKPLSDPQPLNERQKSFVEEYGGKPLPRIVEVEGMFMEEDVFTGLEEQYSGVSGGSINGSYYMKKDISGYWGVVDKSKNTLIACQYLDIDAEKSLKNLFWVKTKNGRWGYVDENGVEFWSEADEVAKAPKDVEPAVVIEPAQLEGEWKVVKFFTNASLSPVLIERVEEEALSSKYFFKSDKSCSMQSRSISGESVGTWRIIGGNEIVITYVLKDGKEEVERYKIEYLSSSTMGWKSDMGELGYITMVLEKR